MCYNNKAISSPSDRTQRRKYSVSALCITKDKREERRDTVQESVGVKEVKGEKEGEEELLLLLFKLLVRLLF